MRENKYHIYLSTEERNQIIVSLVGLKNKLIEQGKYTDAVDDVLCKVINLKHYTLTDFDLFGLTTIRNYTTLKPQISNSKTPILK